MNVLAKLTAMPPRPSAGRSETGRDDAIRARTPAVTGHVTLSFISLAVLWGGGFTLIRVALGGLTPAQLVLARLVLGAAALTAVAVRRRVRLPRGARTWALLTVAGLLGNVIPFLLLSYGEQTASAGIAGTLVGATPLLTLCLAAAVLKAEPVTGRQSVGVAAGFGGVVLVLAPWQGGQGSLVSALLCFGAAASYAGGFVFVRRFLSDTGLTPLGLAAAQLISAAVVQAVLTPALGWRTPQLTAAVVAATTVLGVVGTGLAYLLYFGLIGRLGATRAASVDYLVPVVAVLVGVVALGEPVTGHLVVGGLLVLAGVGYAQSSRPAPARAVPRPVATACGTRS